MGDVGSSYAVAELLPDGGHRTVAVRERNERSYGFWVKVD